MYAIRSQLLTPYPFFLCRFKPFLIFMAISKQTCNESQQSCFIIEPMLFVLH